MSEPKRMQTITQYLDEVLNEKEKAKLKKFDAHVARHHEKDGAYGGAIGGIVTYIIAPTSIGTVYKVSCVCGHQVNITDFDCW